jgi:protein SCO1/2
MAAAVQHLSSDTPEESVAALVDSIKQAPERRAELLALLPEDHPMYTGRSSNAVVRLRGYILAAFEDVGLPAAASPYVLDELQNSREAYVTAGAAKGVRGIARPCSDIIPYLLRAIENVRYLDDALSFATYKPDWPLQRRTTALQEIFKTFAWLGPLAHSALADLESFQAAQAELAPPARAALTSAIELIRTAAPNTEEEHCCCDEPSIPIRIDTDTIRNSGDGLSPPVDVELENQDGGLQTYGEFFTGSISIVVFFYTRCDNPNKCSLSITKLARLQHAIAEYGLRDYLKTAAITYDPTFDVPQRLKAYGENHGIEYDARNQFFRTATDFKELQTYFDLGVNYGDALVNRHRIELFVLDDTGRLAESFTRMQWEPGEVLDRVAALLSPH